MSPLSRRSFLKHAGLVLSAGAIPQRLQSYSTEALPTGRSPNLLIVLVDQLRAQSVGFTGDDPVLTPHLDQFAKESFVATQAVSNYPLCSPARASFLTGKYAFSNGVNDNCVTMGTRIGNELPATERCWSDILADRGYSLGYIGKWHLDAPRPPFVDSYNNSPKEAWNEWCPPERRHGFGFWYAYGTYDRNLTPMYWETHAPRNRPVHIDEWGPEHEAAQVIRFLDNEGGHYRESGKPFALVVAMNPPHGSYSQVPQKYVDPYQAMPLAELARRPNIPPPGTPGGDLYRKNIRNYLGAVSGVDQQFGKILSALEARGLEQDTVVVFMADHGVCLGIHQLRGKNNIYEESLRVPLMIRWPGYIQPRRDDLLWSMPDLCPTLLGLLGLASDIPKDVEGINHGDLILQGEGHRPTSQYYIRVWNNDPFGEGSRGVRTSRYTLFLTTETSMQDPIILYDNRNDPYQLTNVAKDHPEVVRQLFHDELLHWLAATQDPWNYKDWFSL